MTKDQLILKTAAQIHKAAIKAHKEHSCKFTSHFCELMPVNRDACIEVAKWHLKQLKK